MSILELNQVSYSYEKKEIKYCLISVIPLKRKALCDYREIGGREDRTSLPDLRACDSDFREYPAKRKGYLFFKPV